MKKVLFLTFFFAVSLAAVSAKPKKSTVKTPWEQADSIVLAIKKTQFPNTVYNIRDFGARPYRPDTALCLAHDAISLAITQEDRLADVNINTSPSCLTSVP